MVRVARRAGLDQDVALAAQAGLHEAVMHRAGREQRMDRAACPSPDSDRTAAARACPRAPPFSACSHTAGDGAFRPVRPVVLQVDEFVRHARCRQAPGSGAASAATGSASRARSARACSGAGTKMLHSGPICVCNDITMRLAQRIDRRIGDLRELLAEIVVQRAHLMRQNGHRRVVAHGADRLALVLREHADDFLALLRARR